MTDPKKEDREQAQITDEMLEAGAEAHLQMKSDWTKIDGKAPPLGPLLACAYRAMNAVAPQSSVDKRDAERYRWLRSRKDGVINMSAVYQCTGKVYSTGTELDTAIDAALEANK